MGIDKKNDSCAEDNSVYAIVPAKLTSIRLPKKNILDFFGRPLFYYSVKAAQLCPSVNDVYVTSESDLVLELADKMQSQLIKRPDDLSLPKITNLDVLIHSYQKIVKHSGNVPEFIILLQPTHPFRFPKEIEKGINMMKANPSADVLMTVLPDDRLRGGIKEDLFSPEYSLPRNKTQEPKMFFNTGAFYIFRTATTIAQGKMFTEKILPLVLDNPQFEIDIDIESDLLLAKAMMQVNKDKFSFFWN